MYRIRKSFTFDAAHYLPGLPDDHPCSRLHGHTYTVTVEVEAAELVGPGFVVDFGELAPLRQYLDSSFDHQCLNDVVDFPPTSELLARHIGQWFLDHLQPDIPGRLTWVRVAESPTSSGEWEVPQG